ncbi:hypothetical protein GCM10010912_09290 [Paenibacillus albidus]|uniref:Uncharacterized protein n=1 Tax=Paenibacillus albidus TaxID=2041023 RepID=A0A917C305_9BACL|nr:hypothetical protein [Paenibacillus albidus]GGF66429.1 hypothetical protein GCM10010912_09290 [Paenibacillus albidus]
MCALRLLGGVAHNLSVNLPDEQLRYNLVDEPVTLVVSSLSASDNLGHF